MYRSKLNEKLQESLAAVLPILAIVLILSFTIAPLPTSVLMAFLFGAVLLVVGMMFFSLGAELAMSPMGERVGACITKTRRVGIMLTLGFLLGFLITISEPDLQVLANQVQAVPNMVLIVTVAVGVGLFLCFAMLRMLLSVPLNTMLVGFYIVVFVLAMFVPKDFLAVAFDSGGVTTGPMTVPFIMAMGVGVSAIRSDKHSANDSFGLVALCSIGPILAVLILSLIFHPDGGSYTAVVIPRSATAPRSGSSSSSPSRRISRRSPSRFSPSRRSSRCSILSPCISSASSSSRIGVGLAYTYLGLVIFLTGVNVGFMPAGNYLGSVIAGLSCNWIIIPIGMLIGYFIVMAEPAVYVLMRQVEELTDGAIPGSAMKHSLSIGVAVSVGLAMIRVLTGISIFYLLVPGYAVAIVLSFFVPKLFTAIAFDSGGVASGPMATTFLLPFAMGACSAVGGNIVTDAFGVVAMVAMTPLLTIQGLGLLYRLRTRRGAAESAPAVSGDAFALDDLAIIDL
ncbi:MAG: DUF1538 domain-containing protein [Oscillospiraceae bacterium]